MLAALEARGERPDLLVGTSVGAINAAYVSDRGYNADTIESLGAIWRRLRRADVFPFDPLRQALAVAGRRRSLCSRRPLRRLVEANLVLRDLQDGRVPLHIVATDVLSGKDVLLTEGDASSAILASAAIPAVFPPVSRDGMLLMDGGVANNAAISHAVTLGADRVVVLPAGFSCALLHPPATPLAAATHAITLMIEQRLIVEVGHLAGQVDIAVLPPLCPLSVSSVDFGHADELIARAQEWTGRWLDSGGPSLPHPERFLSLHSHHWAGAEEKIPERVLSGGPGS
jgi:NTE family protein